MDKNILHICKKERELGVMATKIENIDSNVKDLKTDVKNFIQKADATYATKIEVSSKITSLSNENEKQEEEIKWNKDKIVTLVEKTGLYSAIVTIGTKVFGWW